MPTPPLIAIMMLGRGRGGIEQCFVDYCRMLQHQSHNFVAITDPRSPYIADLIRYQIPYKTVRVNGLWDLWAYFTLTTFFKSIKPDAIICHGNRALAFAPNSLCPIIHVVHNYLFKRFHKVDYFFAITDAMRDALIKYGVNKKKILVLPNIYDFTRASFDKSWHDPVTIGALGRFVTKKGFAILLKALTILKARGYHFRALIAGDGELRTELQNSINQSHLREHVIMPGWIHDKEAFFDSVDIFCLPSLSEPFGITLLEAMAHKKAIVASDTDGPLHIFEHQKDALIVNREDAEGLAAALQSLMDRPKLGQKMAQQAYKKFRKTYTLEAGAERLHKAIEHVLLTSQDIVQRNLSRSWRKRFLLSRKR